MKTVYKLIIGSVFAVSSAVITLFPLIVLCDNFDPNDEESLETQICRPNAGDPIQLVRVIFILIPILFAIVFLLFLIVRYRVILDIKSWIEKTCDEEVHSLKLPLYYIILSIIITVPTSFVLLAYSHDVFIEALPFSELIIRIAVNGEEGSASSLLIDNFHYATFILFGIGSLWIFFLRVLRKSKKDINPDDYSGSLSLRYYIIASILLTIPIFTVKNFPSLTIYGKYSLVSVEVVGFVTVMSIIAAILVWALERFVIEKFSTNSN